jgi:hypothetical protein
MIYIVLIPPPIWIILLGLCWVGLAHLAYKKIAFRHVAMWALIAAMGLQAIAASSTAVATSLDPIGYFACRMGYYGMLVTFGVCLVEGAALFFLSRIWPRSPSGVRHKFKAWVTVWLLFSLFAVFSHMRSTALCTV